MTRRTTHLTGALIVALALQPRAAVGQDNAAAQNPPTFSVSVTESSELVEDVGTTRRLTRSDIDARSARTLDEALRLLPGIYVRTGGDGTPRIDVRGNTVQREDDGYTLVDLGFTQTLARRYDIVFDVTNLFDQRYDQAYALPREGRAAVLSLRARLKEPRDTEQTWSPTGSSLTTGSSTPAACRRSRRSVSVFPSQNC